MHEVTSAPIFLRLGQRGRGIGEPQVGQMRNISIRGLEAKDIDYRFAATIAGLAGHPIEDVALSDIRLVYRGGGTAADAERRPSELADCYPEPSMFGITPAFGLWVRHARRLKLDRLQLETNGRDGRPPMLLEDVAELTIDGRRAPSA